MINRFRFSTLLALAILLLALLASGCGSSTSLAEIGDGPGFDVPWPGDGPPARTTSDDTVELLGNEYAQLGGDAVENGTAVDMTGGGDLPYAIYTLGGFSSVLELGGVTLDATATGAQLYVGLANYDTNAWEWFAADSGGWGTGALTGPNYRSGNGNASVAVVLNGGGSGSVNSVSFDRVGETDLVPPNPITADPSVGRIIIDWEPIPVAEGYNIYRDVEPALPAPVKLNDELITKTSYSDLSITDGVMYYYFVTSVAGVEESDPSGMLDIFAPEVNLSSPTNPRLINSTETSATVAWDWGGTPPTMFQLYLEDHKDFNLVSPLQDPTVAGTTTQYTFNGLDQGTTYYWRVCPVFGNRGNMTDDRATETGTNNDWTWGNSETVGTGGVPLVAIRAGSDLAATYLNGGDVMFSRRTSGSWAEETALDQEEFNQYVDVAYGGGKFVVISWANFPGDSWVATGTPGTLSGERIHGDGSTEQGHPVSGAQCVATATSSEFIVAHFDQDNGRTMVQTRPISGGSWSQNGLNTGAIADTPYNLESDGANAYLLFKDIMGNQMMFGDKNGGWSFSAAIPPASPAVTFNSDLVKYGTNWVSPLRDATNDRFILAKGTTTPWTIEELSSDDVGSNAKMDAEGTKAGIIYTAGGTWYFVFSDDTGASWEFSEVVVPGSIDGTPDIVFLNGSPYIVYSNGSGSIRAVKGTPPPV